MEVRIARAPETFSDWTGLLQVLQGAFAFMADRIDPPSSVHRLTPTSIATKSQEETLFLAMDDDEVVGCVFAASRSDSLYVSKLAVRKDRQRNGIGRRLMGAVEEHARAAGLSYLELATRIELTENHEAFASLGFIKSGEHAHDGYDHPTFITMRKQLREPLSSRLPGTWLLESRVDVTASGKRRIEPSLGDDPVALLFYDRSGHFAAQFMKRDRSVAAPDGPGGTPNNSRAQGGYDAYFGTYTVDDAQGTVTQRLVGALSAENVGSVLTRAMEVRGDRLVIRLQTNASDGTAVTRTLTWKRVAGEPAEERLKESYGR
jgi:GNAT superfamily N-acetyltransferase